VPHLPNIVVDTTPLLDRSGNRGIGRYVYDLLYGLESIRDEWSDSLDVSAITALEWMRGGSRTRELGAAADSLRELRGTQRNSIVRKRRFLLTPASGEADVLHVAEAIGMPLRKRCPWVVTCYDLIPLRLPDQYLRGRGVRMAHRHARDWVRYHRADVVVAISERTRTDVIEILGIPEERVVAVPTGIDLAHLSHEPEPDDSARRARHGVGSRPYLLFVGEGDPRKDVTAMIRTLAVARRHLDVDLIWAGQLPALHLERFRRLVQAEGVEGNVHFVGFVPDAELAALYRGALALLFLSALEGFGLPVAEAISSGCPVIVVRDSGCDEVAGDAGFVVDPGDHSAAARAVVELATRQGERTRRSRLGVERAARFDRREMARGYVEVYKRLAHAK